MKLLYAEDERSLSEAVVDVLEYHKYKVDAVYDGQDALDYAMNDQYDGIILDVMMPKRSGFEVSRLRAVPYVPASHHWSDAIRNIQSHWPGYHIHWP